MITPPGRERLAHKLLLRCRIYYIIRLIRVVLRYWPYARDGRLDMQTWAKASFEVFKFIEDCGGRFHIKGLSNLKTIDGPVVFISNHMSTTETLVLTSIIFPQKKPVFVVKEQLAKLPFFGAYLKQCITVTRKSPANDFKTVMNKGAEMISNDNSIIIFPQSTRNTVFDPSQFNSLGIKLAKKSSACVIPVALKTDFWGNGRIIKDFGPLDLSKILHFEFGEPFTVNGNGKKEHQQVVSFIKDRIETWQKEEC